jgi:hypothetical protein
MSDFPKALFANIARTYHGAISIGINPGALNRDRADTLIRDLAKTAWLKENQDVYRMWSLGGDPWFDFIKSVGAYTKEVRAWEREQARLKKSQDRELAREQAREQKISETQG